MDILLNAAEIRVLGSLIEKELTTPDYYPLTLNALTNACNQKSNRDPVVEFPETTVVRALDSLREKKLISTVTGDGIRVPKYKHGITEILHLSKPEISILALLMLRGPQTIGELRTRSASMHNFETIAEVESIIIELTERRSQPLARKLSRQAGQKESRFTQLFSGEPQVSGTEATLPLETSTIQVRAENERIAELEKEIKNLRAKIESIEQQLTKFRKQFE